jgi:putative hydrolase of the HAD superfamily
MEFILFDLDNTLYSAEQNVVDDSPDNLKTAKDLGMGTILVGQKSSSPWIDVAVQEAVEVPQTLRLWIQD